MAIGIVNKSPSELRRYRRVPIDLPARVIINGVNECHGRLINMSPGDLAMKAEVQPRIGDAAVVYVIGLDVFEGTVARIFPDGFALSFRLSRVRRALLTERLMEIVNPKLAEGMRDRRIAPRHQMKSQRMVCRLPDGASMFVRVIDMSVDGVALEATKKPPVGSDIHVGRMRGVVMRHTARGFVVVYDHSAREAGQDAPVIEFKQRAG
ncbi:MAG: hypothetical protein GC152_01055 [Alphaproteobacteria bacterium]|nr:hypothetical protein [Alphaproteobacteria bacterium]